LKRYVVSIAMLGLMAATLVACGGDTPAAGLTVPTVPPVENTPVQSNSQPADHITVQHILIGFKDAVGFQGSPPGKAATRTQDEAKKLAYDLLAKAKAGDQALFDQLVKDNTDDSPPGIYSLANNGVTPAQGEYPRGGMVPAFGNVGFSLKVGEIGISDYDPATSPYGWHIIKRIK
jgi:hypothetical protein